MLFEHIGIRFLLRLACPHQGGERAAAAAVSACLEILVRLEKEGSAFVMPSPAPGLVGGSSPQDVDGVCSDGVVVGSAWLSPELKFYHLANACMYGITVVSTATAERHFDWLLTRLVRIGCFSLLLSGRGQLQSIVLLFSVWVGF